MNIKYPYLPEGREIKYVPEGNVFMLEAKEAREELAGDPSYPVGSVLVKDGKVIARAGNGYNRGRQVHVCPRLVLESPTGTGYDLCDLHLHPGHSEQMVIDEAVKAGYDPAGADLYLYGHWWACEPCWTKMIEAGIRDFYVVDDAHTRFHRDVVYPAMLQPSVKTVYIACAITNVPSEEKQAFMNFCEDLGKACGEVGCDAYVPHLHSSPEKMPNANHRDIFDLGYKNASERDVTVAEVTRPSLGAGGEIVIAQKAGKPVVLLSKKGSHVSRFVTGNPAVVYHIEYDKYEDACRQLKNVLKQL